MPRILIVDDDRALAELLAEYLRREGFVVDVAHDGEAGLAQLHNPSTRPDLLILDVMMPGRDGLDTLRELRLKHRLPVIMLSAKGEPVDRVIGLELGADDYLTKPFSFLELLSRIRALKRRSASKPKNVLEAGDLVLDVTAQRAFRKGQSLPLSLTEFRLLEVLARNKGRVVPRKTIIMDVWGNRRDVEENTLDAFVRLLRKKMDSDSHSKLIQTHRGLGYSMGVPPLS